MLPDIDSSLAEPLPAQTRARRGVTTRPSHCRAPTATTHKHDVLPHPTGLH